MKTKRFTWVLVLSGLLTHCGLLPSLDRTLMDLSTLRVLLSQLGGAGGLIGGEVTGLQGTGLRIAVDVTKPGASHFTTVEQNIYGNGRFWFSASFEKDSNYTVRILSQPVNPDQVCVVAGATGVVGNGSDNSVLVQCPLVAPPAVAGMPVFSPPPGIYSHPTSVVISTSTANASIYYTLNGSDPTCNGGGTLYTSPVGLAQPTLPNASLRAIACAPDHSPSAIQIGIYTVTNGQLAPPTVNVPPSGTTYTSTQSVTLTPPAGATVHYTTDGSIPTCTSASTPNPVSVAHSMTIHAIACQADWSPSSIASFYYAITGTVATPSFSHTSGTYNNDFSLSLTTPTVGASIRYSIAVGGDPAVPDCSGSTLYSGPILLNQNDTRIRAIACLAGWADSPATAITTYNFQVASPAFSPVAGTLSANANVTGSTVTSGAVVHLADGTAPACGGLTSVPLTISGTNAEVTKDIYAIACRSGYLPSGTQMASYVMTGTISNLGFGTAGGTFGGATSTTITAGTIFPSGAMVRYTVDGSDPTCSSGTAYTLGDSIPISASLTIKAIACKVSPAWNPSGIVSSTYTITGTVANPSFSIDPAGIYNDTLSVAITTGTAGAHIQYSLNSAISNCAQGTTLANGGTVSITTTGTVLYAIGCKSGDVDSGVVSGTYTLRPNTPTASVIPGTYHTTTTVGLTSSVGTSIYYTIDGSTPSCAPSGTLGSTVNLNPHQGAVTVRAIACRTGFEASTVLSGVYQMNGQVTAPTWVFANDGTNVLTGTAVAPPIVGSQKLCYRVDADPQCSLTNGGASHSLGGECAVGSTAYTGPVTVVASGSYRLIACADNYISSNVQVQNITIAGTVGAVSITPTDGSNLSNDPNVVLSATNSTAIYYRTNGTNPDCSGTGSTLYAGAFVLPPTGVGSAQITAIGCASGWLPSAVSGATYSYKVANPSFSLAANHYTTDQTLTIASTTTGANFFYRVDGTPATCGASVGNYAYSGVISLPSDPNFVNLDGAIDKLRVVGCRTNYHSTELAAPIYTFGIENMSVLVGSMVYVDSATDTKTDTISPTTLRLSSANPAGAFYCFGTGGAEADCAKTAGGAASPSGDFCAAGSTLASLNAVTAAVTGEYRLRACKAGYKHSIPKLLTLTVQEFRPRIFVSNTAVIGGTSVETADAVCNADMNRPFQKPEATYRAFRMGGGRTLTSNWVLEPNTEYFNLANLSVAVTNGTGSRFGTDSSGNIVLANPITNVTGHRWTGMDFNAATNSFELHSNNCSQWTDSGPLTGNRGNGLATDNTFVSASGNQCSLTSGLYCVEQNPRKRIFVTTNPVTIGTTLNGKASADALCNDPADPRKPATGIYKALLRFTNRTHPSTDWVLKPDTTYYRTDRTTVIGTTNGSAVFGTNFTNAVSTEASEQTYLGFGNSWLASTDNCNDYTNSAGLAGGGANAHMTTLSSGFLNSFSAPCNFTTYKIICVEQ